MKPLPWLVGVVGFVLGLPGFVMLLASSEGRIAASVALIGGLLLFALGLYLQRRLEDLDFSILHVDVTLELEQQSKATLTKAYHAKPNRLGLDSWVHRNIASDGPIANIRVDGRAVPPGDIRNVFVGHYEVTARFPAPLTAFEPFRCTLSYDLVDSFMAEDESMIYVVDFPTKTAKITVKLPEPLPCVSWYAKRQLGGQATKLSVERSPDGHQLILELKRPRIGSSYEIGWRWNVATTSASPPPGSVQITKADGEAPSPGG